MFLICLYYSVLTLAVIRKWQIAVKAGLTGADCAWYSRIVDILYTFASLTIACRGTRCTGNRTGYNLVLFLIKIFNKNINYLSLKKFNKKSLIKILVYSISFPLQTSLRNIYIYGKIVLQNANFINQLKFAT